MKKMLVCIVGLALLISGCAAPAAPQPSAAPAAPQGAATPAPQSTAAAPVSTPAPAPDDGEVISDMDAPIWMDMLRWSKAAQQAKTECGAEGIPLNMRYDVLYEGVVFSCYEHLPMASLADLQALLPGVAVPEQLGDCRLVRALPHCQAYNSAGAMPLQSSRNVGQLYPAQRVVEPLEMLQLTYRSEDRDIMISVLPKTSINQNALQEVFTHGEYTCYLSEEYGEDPAAQSWNSITVVVGDWAYTVGQGEALMLEGVTGTLLQPMDAAGYAELLDIIPLHSFVLGEAG